MFKIKNTLIGRNAKGEKYFLSFEVRDGKSGTTTAHEEVQGGKVVSFTGTLTSKNGSVVYDRGLISLGQNSHLLSEITQFEKRFNQTTALKLQKLWDEWHLNDMNSHCEHQNKAIKWDEVKPCPVTGYKAGTAWLVKPIQDSIIEEITALLTQNNQEKEGKSEAN